MMRVAFFAFIAILNLTQAESDWERPSLPDSTPLGQSQSQWQKALAESDCGYPSFPEGDLPPGSRELWSDMAPWQWLEKAGFTWVHCNGSWKLVLYRIQKRLQSQSQHLG